MTSPSPASAEPITIADLSIRCTGCGSAWTDADLAAAKLRDPRILSCCPERKPLTIDGLAARVVELEAALKEAVTLEELQEELDLGVSLAQRLGKACTDLEASEARATAAESLCNSYRGIAEQQSDLLGQERVRATALLEALRECRSGWPDVGDPSHLGLLRRLDALLRTGASK